MKASSPKVANKGGDKSATKGVADFLLEVGCEEIPAGMIPRACAELQRNLEKYLSAANLLEGKVSVMGGPRRLAAMAALRLRQPDEIREVTGPPKSVAFDNVGAPTRAATSFAEKQGVKLADLTVTQTARGEYLVARQTIPGKAAQEILAEVIPNSVLQIVFPRSMTWTGAHGPRFIRPIRWVVALLGGKVLPVEIAGVKAGNWSVGHRFLGAPRIPLTGPKDYVARLRKNFVLADPAERRLKIESEIRKVMAQHRGWRIHADDSLMEQVSYLNEYPAVLLGSFDEAYLELPEEILVTVMRDHQKYFAVEDVHGGLLPHFLAVMNTDRDREGHIRAGHERVLRARFADARFFWDTDQKTQLGDHLPRLSKVTYESRLGSYGDKVQRLTYLARWVAEQWFNSGIAQASVTATVRAAELCKCDLVTEMVREFTELQGIVGGLYARAQGEDDDVAWAIYDHYQPAGPDEPLPRNLIGCAVAVADKLDSLAACFAVGAIPSGSSDPFALRRAALGIVRIILEKKLPFSVGEAISAAGKALGQFPPKRALNTETQGQLREFLLERARFILRERQGFSYDEINAAFVAGADDLVDAARRVAALHAIRTTRNFMPLAVAFKRIRKILEKAGDEGKETRVQPELFESDAERNLHAAAGEVAMRVAGHRRAAKYQEALAAIAELRPPVDKFFDDVMVMAEKPEVRQNRLALLRSLLREFSAIADFSEMVAEDSNR
jgi:glycyl-tRNA synthetase beta chain